MILFCLLLSSFSFALAKFEPYIDNGGTIVGLAGKDYCILASDSRLSQSYLIHSRNMSRIFEVDDGLLLAGSGCFSDTTELCKTLQHSSGSYTFETGKTLSIEAFSQLLACVLYSRRMFPYFTFSLAAGIDKTGVGCLYRYDAVGSFERVASSCVGKGEKLIQGLLDEYTGTNRNEVYWHNKKNSEEFETTNRNSIHRDDKGKTPISASLSDINPLESSRKASHLCCDLDVEAAERVVVDAFRAACEREISIGDGIHVWIIRRNAEAFIDAQSIESQQSTDHLLGASLASATRKVASSLNSNNSHDDVEDDLKMALSRASSTCSSGYDMDGKVVNMTKDNDTVNLDRVDGYGIAQSSSSERGRDGIEEDPDWMNKILARLQRRRGQRFSIVRRYYALPKH